MLVHVCCSVDSHYFLQELRKKYPNERLIGFFYNPNIHPKEEYDLRLFDVKKSCKKLGIDLLVGDYNVESWLERVRGLENAEEKGERCLVCFDDRLENSAIVAISLGESKLTTTLLTSPMKNINDLFNEGDKIAKKYDLEFIKLDARSNGGTQKQSQMAKDSNLYRQNYCGCKFALTKQRERSSKITIELFEDIGEQILPSSPKDILQTFMELERLESSDTHHILQKNSINVYRLLNGMVSFENKVIASYIFTHSKSCKKLKSKEIRWHNIDFEDKKIPFGFSDNIAFLTIESVNLALDSNYQNTIQMLYNPPKYKDELDFRNKLLGSESIKPLIVLDSKIENNITLNIESIFHIVDNFEVIKL